MVAPGATVADNVQGSAYCAYALAAGSVDQLLFHPKVKIAVLCVSKQDWEFLYFASVGSAALMNGLFNGRKQGDDSYIQIIC